MYNFNAEAVRDEIILWIREYFEKNGERSKAVIGISGGKDSSVAAALCVRAIGRERVYGVLMPQGEQSDIDFSYRLCKHLEIEYTLVNIGAAAAALTDAISLPLNDNVYINIPPRLRMTVLYAVSAAIGGRVVNTCNLSENFVGYVTKFGDGAGDFSPLGALTVTEVKAVGYTLGLPEELIEKIPADGLRSSTDEDVLGYKYAALDKYIRTGDESGLTPEAVGRIKRAREMNLHKLAQMPGYNPEI